MRLRLWWRLQFQRGHTKRVDRRRREIRVHLRDERGVAVAGTRSEPRERFVDAPALGEQPRKVELAAEVAGHGGAAIVVERGVAVDRYDPAVLVKPPIRLIDFAWPSAAARWNQSSASARFSSTPLPSASAVA